MIHADALELDDLLAWDPGGGLITFAGQRTLLLDATALGLLREQLTTLLGLHAARGVLTRFGYAHGWRTADVLRDAIPWADEREWRIAGGRLHRLQGLVRFEPCAVTSDDLACALWHHSYEAEQHRLHIGPSDIPVCWTLTGFASGYLSRAHDARVYAAETQCVGCGDDLCRMVARRAEDWPEAQLERFHRVYEQDCLDDALATVRDALRTAERSLYASAPPVEPDLGRDAGLVARSQPMRALLELARRVARVDSTVLVTGESGSGKERVARFIHQQSARAAGPFVAVNCGAIPEQLLEGELFGYKKGAFTGATSARMGLFEAASGGTLLLDEIGEISHAMQVKLLRVLQERRVRRLGENHDRPFDARIIAATHRDLQAAVQAGDMREDFFFRVRVVELRIPPLRQRRDDITPLAQRFLLEHARRLGCPPRPFSRDTLSHLLAYDWPGNVRELQNAIEHALILARGDTLQPHDLPSHLTHGRLPATTTTPPTNVPPADLQRSLDEVERAHILAVLGDVDGSRKDAAERLGIGIATLYRRLKRYREAGFDVG